MGILPMKPDLPPSIRRLIDYGIKTVAPDRVILFGSRARGDARSDSDYDLAFVFLPNGCSFGSVLLPRLPTFPLLYVPLILWHGTKHHPIFKIILNVRES